MLGMGVCVEMVDDFTFALGRGVYKKLLALGKKGFTVRESCSLNILRQVPIASVDNIFAYNIIVA